jgi:hypothetical protein
VIRWGASLTRTCALLACAGCTGQNLYTTPRTLGEQGGQAIVAPQIAFRPTRPRLTDCFEDRCASYDASEKPPQFPVPHAAYRTGIGERGEVGAHGGVDAWGVDGKWNALRTPHFDLALLGRASWVFASLRTHRLDEPSRVRSGVLLHIPILLGINVDRFTLVVSPGYTVVGDAAGRLTHALRAGAGVQVRVTSGVALMPEASILHDVYGPVWLDTFTVGLGLIFPNLADSSKL